MSQTNVYPTVEIPHLWAHQKVSYARNPQGNMFFEGDTIYSYGHHFPMARLITRNGRRVVLMNSNDTTTTTRCHLFAVRRAVVRTTIFHVRDPLHPKAGKQMRIYRAQIKAIWEKSKRQHAARLGSLKRYLYELDTANLFAEIFGLKTRLTRHPDFEKAYAEASAYDTKLQAKRREQRRRKEELDRLKLLDLLPKWKRWEINTGQLPRVDRIYLRHNSRDVETSRGARVQVGTAVRLWRLVQRVKSNPDLLRRLPVADLSFDGYTLNSITPEGTVIIGCHTILFEDMLEIAQQLNIEEK